MRPVTKDNDILAISGEGVMIRTHADSINLVSRTSLGVRLMRVAENDKVVSVAVVDRQEDEPTETEVGDETANPVETPIENAAENNTNAEQNNTEE